MSMRPPSYDKDPAAQRRILRRKSRNRPVLHPDKDRHGYTPVDISPAVLEDTEDRP
jgi:hypothetical protein